MADKDFKSLVPHIEESIPSFIRENDSMLGPFLEAYQEWAEQDDNVQDLYYRLETMSNIDKSVDRFFEYFRQEYLNQLPADIVGDKALTIKNIRDLYRSKGTEKAIKLLFRILFDETIQVEYPGDRILKPDDGSWTKRDVVRTEDVISLSNFINQQVFFETSQTYAIVETAFQTDVGGQTIVELELSGITGDIQASETIRTLFTDSEFSFETTSLVSTYNIVDPGTGYNAGTQLNISGGGGQGAAGFIKAVGTNGEIEEIQLQDPGFGYSTAPTIDLSGQGNGDAQVTLALGGKFQTPGYFVNTKGMLDDIIVLQDGEKFQEFSYVVKSSRKLDDYEQTVKNTVHPAGMFFTGEVKLLTDLSDSETDSLGVEPEFIFLLLDILLEKSVAIQSHTSLLSIPFDDAQGVGEVPYYAENLSVYDTYTFQELYDAYGDGSDLEIFFFEKLAHSNATFIEVEIT